jgi:hypothetical protein
VTKTGPVHGRRPAEGAIRTCRDPRAPLTVVAARLVIGNRAGATT